MKKILLVCSWVSMMILFACSDSGDDGIVIDQRDDSPVEVNFDISTGVIEEGSPAITVNINLSRALVSAIDLRLSIDSDNAVLSEDYVITPAPVNEELILSIAAGSNNASIQIGALVDDDSDEETITFTLQPIDAEGIELGDNTTYTLRIVDISTIDPRFQGCIEPQGNQTLEVVTWNIERFPMTGSTVSQVIDIIQNMDVDLIAVQEIQDRDDFAAVANGLEGWGGELFNVRGGIELGYFYKTSEITSISALDIIFDNLSSPFPRQPVVVEATHVNGLTVKLVNLHLKCCNDPAEGNSPSDFDRRLDASTRMKELFDATEANTNLIVLGDWNDDLDNGAPFQNFEDDPENYLFADAEIAEGSSANWSFPSFPSHLDHILISNELFDNFVSASTIRLEGCVANYSRNVSDHRPVMAVFKAD